MTPSQRDPALKPSVFPNLGRGLPAAASGDNPRLSPGTGLHPWEAKILLQTAPGRGRRGCWVDRPVPSAGRVMAGCLLSPRTTFVWLLLRVGSAVILINAFPKSGVGAGVSSMTGSLLLR